MEELTTAQREVNGQVAMLIKIFQIGGNLDHGDRVRETMMGESIQVCPVKLLFKVGMYRIRIIRPNPNLYGNE